MWVLLVGILKMWSYCCEEEVEGRFLFFVVIFFKVYGNVDLFVEYFLLGVGF